MKLQTRFVAVALAVAVMALAGQAEAQEGAIKHRQSIMKAVGGHMGAMAAILKGHVAFTDDLKGHAHAMAELAKIATRVFPEGSGSGKTRAKAEIWSKPDEFKKAVDTFVNESAKLARVADSGDADAFKAQFRTMGKMACGGCHKPFRKKK